MIGSLYGLALAVGGPLHAVWPDGKREIVPVDDWRGPLLPGDASVLDRCTGPTLDIGCGPGRLAAALQDRGVNCLGIDVTTEAVDLAQAAGAVALRCSVFDAVPGEGKWSTALLLDGNVGIGGSPRVLLARAGKLLAADGVLIVEVDPPGSCSELVNLRLATGNELGQPFPWARLAAPDVKDAACEAGLLVLKRWEEADRWFVELGVG